MLDEKNESSSEKTERSVKRTETVSRLIGAITVEEQWRDGFFSGDLRHVSCITG